MCKVQRRHNEILYSQKTCDLQAVFTSCPVIRKKVRIQSRERKGWKGGRLWRLDANFTKKNWHFL